MTLTDWTNIAVAVGGLATAGTLAVSLALLWQQIRGQRDERVRERLEHASQIAFWPELVQVDINDDPLHPGDRPCITVQAHIVNTSTRPAMSVLALVGVRADIWLDASAQDDNKISEIVGEWSAVAIAPNSVKTPMINLEVPNAVAHIVAEYGDPSIVGELYFTDASGISWIRTSDGRLIEADTQEWSQTIHLSLAKRDELRRQSTHIDAS